MVSTKPSSNKRANGAKTVQKESKGANKENKTANKENKTTNKNPPSQKAKPAGAKASTGASAAKAVVLGNKKGSISYRPQSLSLLMSN